MRFKRRHYLVMLGIALVTILALISGCAPTSSPTTSAPPGTTAPGTSAPPTTPVQSGKTVELRLAHAWANTHLMHIVIQKWADDINAATEGRVKITIYPGGALSTAAQLYDTAATGAADMAWMLHGYTPGNFPLTSVVELPFMGNNAVNATQILWDLWEKYPQMAAEHKNVNVLFIYGIDTGQVMTTSKPVRVMEDVAGLKLRVGSGSTSPMAEALGATPNLMNIGELFDSLQKGVIDGTLLGASAIKTFNLSPVIKHMTMANIFTNTHAVVINNASWAKIPAADQEIINGLSGRAQSLVSAEAFEEEVRLALEQARAANMDIYELPDDELARWKTAMDPIYNQWASDMDAKGLPGTQILQDALALTEKYK